VASEAKHGLRLLAVCNYPSEVRPAHQVFVRAILRELTTLGVEVTVLAPESLWSLAKVTSGFRLAPRFENRDGIPVHRPRYLSFSTLSLPVGGQTRSWTVNARARTVLREARRLAGPFDLCLGHFLYPHGFAAAELADALGLPAVLSLGESSFRRYESAFDRNDIGRLLTRFAGVIANSPILKERCVDYGLPPARVQVFPNGVSEAHFYPRERGAARRQCGLPAERPIVAFVGQFIERKGAGRVLEAIRPHPEVGAIFLGYGPQRPSGAQVLFEGAVPHEDVPVWLSAADMLVLPTLDEGCSNAVLEALFCGLPVVTSDLPFNRAIVDEEVAVLVDPRDVSALGAAISSLVAHPERRAAMSRAALLRARSFRLTDRAQRILAFLQTVCPPRG
jgi:glycosyltransferase involved in cell wall biosynthesis